MTINSLAELVFSTAGAANLKYHPDGTFEIAKNNLLATNLLQTERYFGSMSLINTKIK